MSIWSGDDGEDPIGEDNYKKRELAIMAKVKCNHCKCKYSYKSAKGISNLIEEVKLTAKMDIIELDGKYYCKGCRQSFITYLIDKVFIIEKAKQIGMRFPGEDPNWRDVQYKESSTIMKCLEKLKLVKKIPFDPEKKLRPSGR